MRACLVFGFHQASVCGARAAILLLRPFTLRRAKPRRTRVCRPGFTKSADNSDETLLADRTDRELLDLV